MSDYPEDLRALVDAHLDGLRFSETASTAGLEEAMRYSLLAGGKRIRPVLSLATARSLGADPEAYLAAASAKSPSPARIATSSPNFTCEVGRPRRSSSSSIAGRSSWIRE